MPTEASDFAPTRDGSPATAHRQASSAVRPQSIAERLKPTAPALRAYFYSGWTFLIPYLLIYLLYAWQKWPAIPVAGNRSMSTVLSSPVPCLLHVYWALHAIHLVLATIAFRSWWLAKGPISRFDVPNSKSESVVGSPAFDVPAAYSVLARLAPWALLALIFAIPGVYLEWPADPWEHLRRITEWGTHPVVANHSAGYKSFYFFVYSWVGLLSPLHLLSWLNVYYTAVCLLLAWQYYRLAKAVGLDRRWAFLSVIVNVLTFGNSCFSFYQYYALASTIFAQIGTIALTRIAFGCAKGQGRCDRRQLPVTGSAEQSRANSDNQERKALPRGIWRRLSAFRTLLTGKQPPVGGPSTVHCPPRGSAAPYSLLRLAAASATLLALIAFNHVQGLGTAGLGVGAVVIWRLIEWKRSMIFWLGAIAVVLSVATVLWWPRQPQIDEVFRPDDWLNAWYGFNLFAWPSPAADRMMQIVGLFGLLNLIAGIFLLWRNHVVGWITFTPIIALSLPFMAIPFANSIANDIIIYHRMFFAIPAGLASVGCFSFPLERLRQKSHDIEFLAVIGVIALLAVVSPGGTLNNRLWNSLAVIPDDLRLKHIVSACEASGLQRRDDSHFVSTGPGTGVIESLFHIRVATPFRTIGQPTSDLLNVALDRIPASSDTVHPTSETTNAAADLKSYPLATNLSTWTSLSGPAPKFVDEGSNSSLVPAALQNLAGARSDVFDSALVPIDRTKTYRLKVSVRQRNGTKAVAYLAVAWYDVAGNLLPANVASPEGAGFPAGWSNGTYSYFGLAGSLVPKVWSTYAISFGFWDTAVIPPSARFMRIGALLNYNATPAAVVQLSNVDLREMPKPAITVIVPLAASIYTPSSQAAQASLHWPAQQAASDHAGAIELRATAYEGGAIGMNSKGAAFYHIPSSAIERVK